MRADGCDWGDWSPQPDKVLMRERIDLDSLAWLAHPWEAQPWKGRGSITAVKFAADNLDTDEAIDFATAVLFDIWRL